MSYANVSISVFGAPRVIAGGNPVALTPGVALLCGYLALAPGDGQRRTVAAHQLFGGDSDSAARRRLSTALWRLRSAIREQVGIEIVNEPDSHSVALRRSEEIDVDVDHFERIVLPIVTRPGSSLTDGEVAALEKAVALHRGSLIEPCNDEWVLGPRQRYENLFLTALDHLVQHSGLTGSLSAASAYAERAFAIEPLREDIHRHLMTAYGAAGRLDLVESAFQRCRQVLVAELGADPMPETITLYARLMGGSRATAVTKDALVRDLEHARREITRLAEIVDRALDRLHR